MDGQTDRWTDKRMIQLHCTRCPHRTFPALGNKIEVPCERSCHKQYESSITFGKKVMAKVKVFQKKVKLQG